MVRARICHRHGVAEHLCRDEPRPPQSQGSPPPNRSASASGPLGHFLPHTFLGITV